MARKQGQLRGEVAVDPIADRNRAREARRQTHRHRDHRVEAPILHPHRTGALAAQCAGHGGRFAKRLAHFPAAIRAGEDHPHPVRHDHHFRADQLVDTLAGVFEPPRVGQFQRLVEDAELRHERRRRDQPLGACREQLFEHAP